MKFVKIIIPAAMLNWYHLALALLGIAYFRFPSRRLNVIGVTGTNGKSTTVEMISRILREAGFKTASTSSIRFQIGDKEWRNTFKMTMPGRLFFQKFLRRAADAGCTHAVIEITSEGILQHRHRFINFHTAVFTNLSPEHIERHGGFENYKKTKGKLFLAAKKAHVINVDDEHAGYYLQFPAKQKFLYSIRSDTKYQILNTRYVNGANVISSDRGIAFKVENTDFSLRLLGEFNVSNALAAICVGLSQGISLEVCKQALEKMEGVPGRMELVIKEPFRVFVDYAFTPNALEKVYQNLKSYQSSVVSRKLICVLGAAGGGRDKWKRPVLGKIAATYCDKIILTDEDPYEEDPKQIIEDIAKGAEGKEEKILDRREAIRKALSYVNPGDTIIITGKGSEDSMAIAGGKKIPWDEREVVKEEFAKRSPML